MARNNKTIGIIVGSVVVACAVIGGIAYAISGSKEEKPVPVEPS